MIHNTTRARVQQTCPLLLGFLLGACSGADSKSPPDDDTAPTEAEAPATAHWMADVFPADAAVAIGQILLPGAFNSSSYACDVDNGISPDAPEVVRALWGEDDSAVEANRERVVGWARTQERAIGQQLEDGIRFIEINVTMRDGEIVTWHSVYGVPLSEVLDEVVAYAVAWPDEVVVLTFGLSIGSDDWPLLAEALAAPRADGRSLCDLLYDGPEDAALASIADVRARGRSLIWAPEGELRAWLDARGDCPLSHGGTDRVWSITVSPEGVASAIDGAVASRTPERLLINDFVFSLDGSASVLEQAGYIATYPGLREASAELGFLGDFPSRLIDTYDTDGQMNVLAGAFYEDTALIEAAIEANRRR